MPNRRKSKPKELKKLPKEVREMFAKFGSEGGKIGGKLRWEGVTPEEHSKIARKAAQARWKKAKKD
jgi:hypothetical protein